MNHGLTPEQVREVNGILATLFPQGRVLLFGSRARGTHQAHSDLDFALDLGEPVPRQILADLKAAFEESDLPFRVDLLDYRSIPESMRANVDASALIWNNAV